LRFADWNGIFGDEIMTTSLLDRLTSKGHIISSNILSTFLH